MFFALSAGARRGWLTRACTVSADRSTILDAQQQQSPPDPARAARLYQPQAQAAPPPGQAHALPVGYAPPFYESADPRAAYPPSDVGSPYGARGRGATPSSAGDLSPAAPRGRQPAPTSTPSAWQETWRAEAAAQPYASGSAARRPSSTLLGKRTASERDDDDSEEQSPVRKVSKKTAIACDFCRGKLPAILHREVGCMHPDHTPLCLQVAS